MTQDYLLHPAQFKLDGGAMFGIIPKPLWEKKMIPDEFNRILLSLRIWVHQTHDRLTLIDTGIGDYHDPKFNDRFAVKGELSPLSSLCLQAGFKVEEVTDVILTHLHFDHAGGLSEKNTTSFPFPHAKIHLHKKHFEYAKHPTLRDQGSFLSSHFLPLIEDMNQKNKIVWHEKDEGELLPGLHYKVSHGHTPYLLHPYSETYFYMADLVPTSAHLPIPWVMGYDIAPGQTTKDKQDIYQFILNHNLTMIFEHDPKFWGAKILDLEAKQTNLFSLSENEKIKNISL
jgi:glyoxylase-like metal-dependent hydrolase (beta-lactamase superfamily II)